MIRLSVQDWVAGALSGVLLIGAAADRASLAPPVDPTAYHQHICDIAKRVNWSQGPWAAIEDAQSEKLESGWVRANVFMDRHLSNAVTGHTANLLVEQCNDARDLIPHFPANCYPGRGMISAGTAERSWQVGDLSIDGTEYLFDQSSFQSGGALVVDNFMILPTGEFCRDMKEVKRKLPVADRYVGIGEIQVVFPAAIPQAQRDADLKEILLPCHDLIDAIRRGPGA